MGYAEAAVRQANIVPTASARMLCKIHCLLTAAEHGIEESQIAEALQQLAEAESILLRGIECGAIVDPWTVLGFGGQFSLFPAVENSVPDLRVDDLIELIEHIFTLYSRLWHQAVVAADNDVQKRAAAQFLARAEWWDRFATTSVSSVKRVAGREIYDAAARVAERFRHGTRRARQPPTSPSGDPMWNDLIRRIPMPASSRRCWNAADLPSHRLC